MRWSFLLIMLCIISCKKKDTTPPEILVNAPNTSTAFQFGDYIFVEADITDDKKINTVELELWDIGLNQRYYYKLFEVDADVYALNHTILIDDVHLETGGYYVKIQVSDGKNNKSEFIKISITGAARVLSEVVFVSEIGGSYSLNLLNSGNPAAVYQLGSDFLNFAVNSWDQQVICSGDEYSDLVAVDWPDQTLLWQETANSNLGSSWFTGFNYDQSSRLTYSASANGSKYLYYPNGNISLYCNTYGANYVGTEGCLVGDGLLVDETSFSGQHVLAFYNGLTGVIQHNLPVLYNTIGMYSISAESALCFMDDDNGVLNFVRYSKNSNMAVTINTKNFIELNGHCSDGNNKIFMAFDDGIYTYDFVANNLVLVSNFSANDLTFDTLNNELYAIDHNTIKIYSSAGIELGSYPVNGGVAIDLLYNK